MSKATTDKTQYINDFVQKESAPNEITIKSEYDKNYKVFSDNNNENNIKYAREQDLSCYYNSKTSVPKTILITNYPQDDHSIGTNQNNMNKSSITIVTHNSDTEHSINNSSANNSTVVLDRINICINNHFNDSRTSNVQKSSLINEKNYEIEKKTNNFENDLVSSKTTKMLAENLYNEQNNHQKQFIIGEDVLVQKKDNRFYLGTIIIATKNECLIKFDDNTEYWSHFDDITKLNINKTNTEPLCVVCKKINKNDLVEVCERCGRGYHQSCTDGSYKRISIWYCRRCTAPNGFTPKNDTKLDDKSITNSFSDPTTKQLAHKSQLPYNPDSLSWDRHHRVNMEQIYCYCGYNGEWYKKMLQCCKCQQWFHDKCIHLNYPLYCGDRFYIFVCSICNNGSELVRRFEMKWIDIVHLLLFNLTINNQKKYYDVNNVIVPYAVDNWQFLQLPLSIQNLSISEISNKIYKTLTSNSSRFKCGREIKKRRCFFGLRTRVPPPAMKITFPIDLNINDEYLEENTKFVFIKSKYILDIPGHIESIMTGESYLGENSDNESSGGISDQKFFSDYELSCKSSTENSNQTLESNKDYDEPEILSNQNLNSSSPISLISDKCDSIEFDITKDRNINLDTFSRNKFKRNRKRGSSYYSYKLRDEINEAIEACDSSDETSSKGTLDLIIPPLKNFNGRNHPFRLTPKKSDNNINNKDTILQRRNTICCNKSQAFMNNLTTTNSKGKLRLVRTVKRRLSAKDIMIGPNKEIKRRRLTKRSSNVEVISTQTIDTLPKSAAYLPIRNNSKDLSLSMIRSSFNTPTPSTSSASSKATTPSNLESITNVFNIERRLRQRKDKNYSDCQKRNLRTNLTNNTNPRASFGLNSLQETNDGQSDSELQSSVNHYFGAVHGVNSGENYEVLAKRRLKNGTIQCLIEFQGFSEV